MDDYHPLLELGHELLVGPNVMWGYYPPDRKLETVKVVNSVWGVELATPALRIHQTFSNILL